MSEQPFDGARLRELRLGKHWSQRQLADKLGTDSQTVRAWEKGRWAPGAVNMRAILDLFGVTQDALFLPIATVADARAAVSLYRAEPGDPDQPPDPSLPNQRHAGIHELLALHESGAELPGGLRLSETEEEGLRTYGRSGPPAPTLMDAVAVVLQWRDHTKEAQPPSDAAQAEVGRLLGQVTRAGAPVPSCVEETGVEPGVRELLSDEDLCAVWAIAADEAAYLRSLRPPRRISTAAQAVQWLLLARSLPEAGTGDENGGGASE